MEEKSLPFGVDSILIVDDVSRIQAKEWSVFSLGSLNPGRGIST
jgi:hypothetical protein